MKPNFLLVIWNSETLEWEPAFRGMDINDIERMKTKYANSEIYISLEYIRVHENRKSIDSVIDAIMRKGVANVSHGTR